MVVDGRGDLCVMTGRENGVFWQMRAKVKPGSSDMNMTAMIWKATVGFHGRWRVKVLISVPMAQRENSTAELGARNHDATCSRGLLS